MKRMRIVSLSGAAAAATLASLLLASPAQAATTSNGCTVTPSVPLFSGLFTAGGAKRISLPVDITCTADVSVEVQRQMLDQDLLTREGDASDDPMGSVADNTYNVAAGAIVSTDVLRTLQFTGPAATEGNDQEVYQKVRFRVTSGPVTSAWTNWELTQVRSIVN